MCRKLYPYRADGDLNNDGAVLVADAILDLKAMAEGNIERIRPNDVASCIEVNGDGRIGFSEMIYILQKASGMR